MRYTALILAACFLLTPLEAASGPSDRANTLVVPARRTVKVKRNKVNRHKAARRVSRPRNRAN